MPLEQRFCSDDAKTFADHLAQQPAVETEIRCGAPSRRLRFRAIGAGYRDTVVDRHPARHIQLLLGSPARRARLVARADGRARNGAAQHPFASAARSRFSDSELHDDVRTHVLHDNDAPLCCRAVSPQRARRHTRSRLGLRTNAKAGSPSRRNQVMRPGRVCVRNSQAKSRTGVRFAVVRLSCLCRHPENIGERISLPINSNPPAIVGAAGSK